MAWWIRVTVRGHSMSPTLHDGQRLVARRLRRHPRRGDVIVFRVPDDELPHRIKRVAAVAGDPLPDWLAPALPGLSHVPPGHVAVVGDNPRSQDSRQLGLVDCRDVLGRVPGT
ncbi:signal peptidase I [Streptoalloteichus hindustanus]|uniref:Signal peptidase I n=1 Tax=Streptoalloteichus hindustanus TaxID=2017 RepID=A0A1M5FNQ4_STRHI|nr:signal peptidase I [Streptoalloteichus hindustanus]SHF93148.1 signal peptidase I [Streptoalloteichus hindustanus]